MKSLLLGILLIILIGVGGFVYRDAVEHPGEPIPCPLDALVCPDGTAVSRTGLSCNFPACPPPNVSLPTLGISFALPSGFVNDPLFSQSGGFEYVSGDRNATSTSNFAEIGISSYAINASSTALATIQATALGDASGLPIPVTSFTSVVLGTHRFTVVAIGSFEGVVTTAYYLARESDVLRFDAIDHGVPNWTEQTQDVSTLPAHSALIQLLTTLQGQ
jgi:hypothetical protein